MSPNSGLVAAGAGSAAAYAYLAYVSRIDSHPPLLVFYACLAVCIAGWLYGYRYATGLRAVVFFTVLFRAIGFLGAPLYEDDFFRYLWDGYLFGTMGTPYGYVPSEFFAMPGLPPRMEEVLGGVNFPDIPTIYGPIPELSFLLSWFIAPGELWPLKLIYILVDAGLCAAVWLGRRQVGDLLLYAWCPLVIKEVAFTAHTDVLAAGLLFLAWLLQRRERSAWAGAALGLAIGAKITVVAAAPFLLWRARPRVWLTTALAVGLCYAPFVLRGATDLDGLKVFSQGWEFNSFGFALVKLLVGDRAARVAGPALFAAFCAYVCLRKPVWLRPDILLGVFLFVAPVVNPWYLLAIAPFVAVYPSAVGIAALAAVLLSYVTEGNLGWTAAAQFNHPIWVRFVQAGIVGSAAVWDARRR